MKKIFNLLHFFMQNYHLTKLELRADNCGAQNFHYTTPSQICQAKFLKKMHKILIPKLCKIFFKTPLTNF